MAGSQLKQLKANLKADGLTGGTKQKKRKGQGKGPARNVSRKDAIAASQHAEWRTNHFEVQTLSRGREKYDLIDNRSMSPKKSSLIQGKPGVSKSLGEERRKRTLLTEMMSRKKAGGINDRRFGENDPSMSLEDRMLQRYAKEKEKIAKNASVFDLEADGSDGADQLTHNGRSISFAGPVIDDYQESDISGSESSTSSRGSQRMSLKRKRDLIDSEQDPSNGQIELVERRKSKNEVMKEVIAKSKLHKYERQQAKDDDEDAREALDKEFPEIFTLMKGQPKQQAAPQAGPVDRMNFGGTNHLIDNGAPAPVDYDEQVKALLFDKRSQPTNKSKTEEEIATERAEMMHKLEMDRLQRMRGEKTAEEIENGHLSDTPEDNQIDEDDQTEDDAQVFGLGKAFVERGLDVEDEDDFYIEDDLIAGSVGSDLSDDEEKESEMSFDGDERRSDIDEDEEFLADLDLPPSVIKPMGTQIDRIADDKRSNQQSLTLIDRCPENHEDFIEMTKIGSVESLPLLVQRIRSSFHPKIDASNKAKMATFCSILVDHVSYLARFDLTLSLAVIEQLIRHIHSLAKMYPDEVSAAFRRHLKDIHDTRPTGLHRGDLMLLAAIGAVFPTSDHFHSVVTPANLTMARYLSNKQVRSCRDLGTGLYVVTLMLHYQRLSKRYIPEAVNYTFAALRLFLGRRYRDKARSYYFLDSDTPIELLQHLKSPPEKLSLRDIPQDDSDLDKSPELLAKSFRLLLGLIEHMVDLWDNSCAFQEFMTPSVSLLLSMIGKQHGFSVDEDLKVGLIELNSVRRLILEKNEIAQVLHKVEEAIQKVEEGRRPLELHHHRPLAIKMSIPKFEESYNPDKRYDPDRDRAELGKLKAQHKKEQKGALRELRKDSSFIARENLREKKEKDREYEKKYKRLIAEIQGEEGHEANEYAREKRLRKGKK